MEPLYRENKYNLKAILFFSIIVSISAMFFFSFFGAGRSIWLDEAHSVFVASRNFTDIITILKNDAHPPLYFLLFAIWIRLFGISEFVIRSLSGIFYMFGVVAVYALGKHLYKDRTTGFLCSFLYMLSPVAIRQAQNARMYSLLGLLGIISTLFFLRLFLSGIDSKKDFVLYVIVNILGTFTHYWFFFIVLSQITSYVLLLPKSSFRKFLAAILLSLMPFGILWFRILLLQIYSNCTFWLPKPGIRAMGDTLLSFTGVKRALLFYTAFLTLMIFRVENTKIKFRNFSILKEFIFQKRNLVFFIFLFVSLLIPWAISQVKPIYWVGRYTIITLLPLAMLIGPLLSKFGNKFLVFVCCYVLLAAVTVDFVNYKTRPRKYSDKITSGCLIKQVDNDDILIFTSLSRAPIDYYLRLVNFPKKITKISFPSELALHPGWRNVEKMLKQKYKLEREADDIVSWINSLPDSNQEIWLFYGYDREVGKILKVRIDADFSLKERKDLRGAFYNTVFIYQR